MLPRFFAVDLDSAAGSAWLAPDEAHHLVRVVRLRPGDEIAVFDGSGREYRGRIERIARDGAHVRLLEEIAAAAEPSVLLTLAQGFLKAAKMEQVVRDATMMGVSAIVPLVTAHTSVRPKRPAGKAPVERWRRVAIASAKQCRRAVLPAIHGEAEFGGWIHQDRAERRFILVEPAGAGQGTPLSRSANEAPASASLMVGPEGGWSAEEIDAALSAGWTAVTLGRRTLRADVAALVAIGILQYAWGDL